MAGGYGAKVGVVGVDVVVGGSDARVGVGVDVVVGGVVGVLVDLFEVRGARNTGWVTRSSSSGSSSSEVSGLMSSSEVSSPSGAYWMASRLTLASVAGGVAARSGKSLASVGEVVVVWPPSFGGVSGGRRPAALGPASGGWSDRKSVV